MRDPREGVTADGMIVTGAARSRVPEAYEPLLDALLLARPADVGLYLYGSVATGAARPPGSDVDLIGVGWPAATAHATADELGTRFGHLCRGVEIVAARAADFIGEADAAYGNRVFHHHYCVHLAGPALEVGGPFPADARAARGFNGDIARHAAAWRDRLDRGEPGVGLALARKTLLAVAGLVSVHDGIWTTDRDRAAARWGQLVPEEAPGLADLRRWADPTAPPPDPDAVRQALDGTVARVVRHFRQRIGLWGASD